MPEGLREWALSVCAASVFCGVLNMLAPEEKYEKIINTCLAVFMIFVIASPVKNMQMDILLPSFSSAADEKGSELESLIVEQAAGRMSAAAEELISEYLEENGIAAQEICVDMDIAADGCISIGQVTVELSRSCPFSAESVKSMLSGWLGISCITVTGG